MQKFVSLDCLHSYTPVVSWMMILWPAVYDSELSAQRRPHAFVTLPLCKPTQSTYGRSLILFLWNVKGPRS